MRSIATIIRYYWRHARQFPRLLIPPLIIFPVQTIIGNYLTPLILASVINRLSNHDYTPHHVWASFGSSLLLYLAASLIGGVLLWRVFDLFYWRLEGNVVRSIAQEVFSKLTRESATFHANEFAGSLVSATNKLTGSYIRIADTTMFQVAPLLVGLVFVSIIMARRSPIYTVLLVSISLFYIAISFFITRGVREKSRQEALAESRQTGVLADAITNVMAIKSFAREQHEDKLFATATNDTYHKLLGMMFAFQKQQFFLSSVIGLLSTASLLAAVVSVVSFNANLSTAFLIFNYTAIIVGQLFQFSNNALRSYNRAFGDAAEMVDILQRKVEVVDPAQPETVRISDGTIAFRDVEFTHDGSDEALFHKLNLHIKPGEKIGLVGHSGSGKTTLTRLLLRFSDINSGSIEIDGQNIAAIRQADLHDHIAYVPQEPLLFHRSIHANIGYGDLSADKATITAVSKLAHADEFVNQLPQGYDTLVGERGVKLSGGQRQRIAIARAMLKNAPILVLDEATSALDSESEVLIQDALWKLMEGRTAIVIAHRLSTIQKMDRIIVLDNGKIVEQGSHKELLAKNGSYAKLWAHQSGGFIEE